MSDPLTTVYRSDLREDEGDGRYYYWKDERFISVTNALSQGMPSFALQKWAPKVVAEYVANNWDEVVSLHDSLDAEEFTNLLKNKPWRERDRAGDRGSAVHDIAEVYATTGELPSDLSEFEDEVAKKAALFVRFLETVKPEILAVEGVVFNRTHRYAGTFDLIIDIDFGDIKGRFIVDIKTGKGVYEKAALQQTAYRNADFIAIGDEEVPMLEVDGALILHIQQTQWKLLPADTEYRSWQAFLAVLEVAYWFADGESKDAIGRALTKGR